MAERNLHHLTGHDPTARLTSSFGFSGRALCGVSDRWYAEDLRGRPSPRGRSPVALGPRAHRSAIVRPRGGEAARLHARATVSP